MAGPGAAPAPGPAFLAAWRAAFGSDPPGRMRLAYRAMTEDSAAVIAAGVTGPPRDWAEARLLVARCRDLGPDRELPPPGARDRLRVFLLVAVPDTPGGGVMPASLNEALLRDAPLLVGQLAADSEVVRGRVTRFGRAVAPAVATLAPQPTWPGAVRALGDAAEQLAAPREAVPLRRLLAQYWLDQEAAAVMRRSGAIAVLEAAHQAAVQAGVAGRPDEAARSALAAMVNALERDLRTAGGGRTVDQFLSLARVDLTRDPDGRVAVDPRFCRPEPVPDAAAPAADRIGRPPRRLR